MAENKKEVCIVADCEEAACTRGLCKRDYGAMSAAVKSEKITWDKLIEAGLAMPSTRSPQKAKATVALDKILAAPDGPGRDDGEQAGSVADPPDRDSVPADDGPRDGREVEIATESDVGEMPDEMR